MDLDKRYCQNRTRKRKRNIVYSPIEDYKNVSSGEDERQFKLRRFVADVSKFVSENDSCPNQKLALKKTNSTYQKTVKKKTTSATKPIAKRGLFQNGIQTKFYTRGGALTREMTARLDENLHQIISLANENSTCHQCKNKTQWKSGPESLKRLAEIQGPLPQSLTPRRSPSCGNWHYSPGPSVNMRDVQATAILGSKKPRTTLSQLDKELYPVFTHNVTASCIKSKSAHFKNNSYILSLKRTLLEIYISGKKDNSQELSCPSEGHKTRGIVAPSSCASPSTDPVSSPHNSSGQGFKELNFSWPKLKTTMQFLEETIGPSSSGQCTVPSPELQHQQHCSPLSPPVIGYQRPQSSHTYVPRAPMYMHEPINHSFEHTTSPYNIRSTVFDGGGDRFQFNYINSFLPPVEEDSPEFRYFPRKMF